MLCVPTASVDVVNVATPLLRLELPMFVDPSMKVTVPVGVPLSKPGCAVTVEVKVTFYPKLEGLGEEVSAVVVGVKLVLMSTPNTPSVLPQSLLLTEQLVTNRSSLPSPFTSAALTEIGCVPAVKVCWGKKMAGTDRRTRDSSPSAR